MTQDYRLNDKSSTFIDAKNGYFVEIIHEDDFMTVRRSYIDSSCAGDSQKKSFLTFDPYSVRCLGSGMDDSAAIALVHRVLETTMNMPSRQNLSLQDREGIIPETLSWVQYVRMEFARRNGISDDQYYAWRAMDIELDSRKPAVKQSPILAHA